MTVGVRLPASPCARVGVLLLAAVGLLPVPGVAQLGRPVPVLPVYPYFLYGPYPYGPYPVEVLPGPVDPVFSCYRMGRCSTYDLYYYRDRPNRLARLAPETSSPPPPAAVMRPGPPVLPTPEENIQPTYRSSSQVRDEYRAPDPVSK